MMGAPGTGGVGGLTLATGVPTGAPGTGGSGGVPAPPGFTAGTPGTGGAGGVAPEDGMDTEAGGRGGTGGVPAPVELAAGTAGDGGTGGVAPDDDRDTEAGGRGGTGGVPAEEELAGGTTTGGAGCPGPPVNDDAARCSDWGMSAGLETICCRIPTHGTPPRVGSAVATGPSRGALKNIPALPIMTTTMPFLVRDMCSPVFLRPCRANYIRVVTGLTEPTISKFAAATILALRNRCEGEAVPSPWTAVTCTNRKSTAPCPSRPSGNDRALRGVGADPAPDLCQRERQDVPTRATALQDGTASRAVLLGTARCSCAAGGPSRVTRTQKSLLHCTRPGGATVPLRPR